MIEYKYKKLEIQVFVLIIRSWERPWNDHYLRFTWIISTCRSL